jgi:hypothetical protein
MLGIQDQRDGQTQDRVQIVAAARCRLKLASSNPIVMPNFVRNTLSICVIADDTNAKQAANPRVPQPHPDMRKQSLTVEARRTCVQLERLVERPLLGARARCKAQP